VPEDQLECADNQLLWCHSFYLHASDYPSTPFGAPFAMSVRAGENAADFRLRLAARLGESPETLRHSWKMCRFVGIEKYEPIADDAVLLSLGGFPAFVPYRYMLKFQNDEQAWQGAPRWSDLPALGIQRPNNVPRNRAAPVDHGIHLNDED
jgi:hypothetical protein